MDVNVDDLWGEEAEAVLEPKLWLGAGIELSLASSDALISSMSL